MSQLEKLGMNSVTPTAIELQIISSDKEPRKMERIEEPSITICRI
jgi:hypothetical protein